MAEGAEIALQYRSHPFSVRSRRHGDGADTCVWNAQHRRDAWINARQNTQQHRIFKGVQSGELNFNETKKLPQSQARVQNLENQAEANGVVTPFERARLFLKKHN